MKIFPSNFFIEDIANGGVFDVINKVVMFNIVMRFNDEETRDKVTSIVESTLLPFVNIYNDGVYNCSKLQVDVICNETINTPEVIDNCELRYSVFIRDMKEVHEFSYTFKMNEFHEIEVLEL